MKNRQRKRNKFAVNWNGYTRIVLFVGHYAIKIPSLRKLYSRMGLGAFLRGLESNKQESKFSKMRWKELCPVRVSWPFGLLLVMERAEPLSDEDWSSFCYETFVTRGNPQAKVIFDDNNGDVSHLTDPIHCIVPSENKIDSYGYYDNRIVAVDYGGYR